MTLKFNEALFVKGARDSGQFPDSRLPEYAFYGKSNCGKSSLINMVCQRKQLVKTGATPGKTREINFFAIDQKLMLVDLPGVGYAKLPGSTRRTLGQVIDDYCYQRSQLRLVFYLMDLRREPSAEAAEILDYLLESAGQVVLVGTKADKLGSNQLRQTISAWQAAFGVSPEQLIISSASKNQGRKEILDWIAADLERFQAEKSSPKS